MNKKTIKFTEYLDEQLKDLDFKKEFDEEELFASLAIQIAKVREEQHMTQKELAKRLGTTQQTVSRLEDIHDKSYSLKTLSKLAKAFGKRIHIEFV